MEENKVKKMVEFVEAMNMNEENSNLNTLLHPLPLLYEQPYLNIPSHQRGPKLSIYAKPARKMKYVGVGRNATCPCGSGKKFKHCCINIEQA